MMFFYEDIEFIPVIVEPQECDCDEPFVTKRRYVFDTDNVFLLESYDYNKKEWEFKDMDGYCPMYGYVSPKNK